MATKKKLWRMLLYDMLTILAVMAVAAAFLTHPASDQSCLIYLIEVAKRLWSR